EFQRRSNVLMSRTAIAAHATDATEIADFNQPMFADASASAAMPVTTAIASQAHRSPRTITTSGGVAASATRAAIPLVSDRWRSTPADGAILYAVETAPAIVARTVPIPAAFNHAPPRFHAYATAV